MRTHPISSERLIRDVPGLARLAPAIRAEHERWDGTGYPDGLAGDQIPIASRITFVCDAYHAMTTDRPYRQALPAAEAQAQISAGIATQFCPTAAQALLHLLIES
jgi:HD-GYP domain-containing protein (c-di-GMP phosphodiesterase class II)